ncbi:MAG: amino acid ABC transporter substrate-binding protein [Firmicutes bacterium]|nr:amino acid ABC transporter substrate-binding protein [Bacillota bacterium]MBR6351167.1 amino acid ABC transporter substrate-binding protein [Bacillota bacterium]
MKKVIVLLISLMLVFSLAACGGGKSSDSGFTGSLLTKDKIIIATSPDYPPFEYLDSDGSLKGFEIEMIAQLVDVINEQNKTNLGIEFKQMDFSTIISAVQAGQVDIGMSAFSYTEERAQMVNFCTSHLTTKQMIITRDDTGIASADDFKAGMKVGAPTGTTAYTIVSEWFPDLEVVNPGDYTVLFQNLLAGNLDLVVADYAVGINYVNEHDNFVMCEEPLLEETLCLINNKEKPVVTETVNKALDAYLASDTYKALCDKYGM